MNDRVLAFSDGVFAVAITLLVLGVAIQPGETTAAEVLHQEWSSYLAFALSFLIVGYFWIGHHRRFQGLEGNDLGFVVINLALLFCIVSMPFATSLIDEFAPERAAVVAYATLVSVTSAIELLQWVYAVRRGLLGASVDRRRFWDIVFDLVPALLVFLLSIPIAYIWDGMVAMICWAATFVLSPVVGVVGARIVARREPGGFAAPRGSAGDAPSELAEQ